MEPTFQYRNNDGSTTKVYEIDEDRELRVYNSGHGYSVADGGMWLTGLYDSIETAVAVANLPDDQLEFIPPVWRIDNEDRPATMAEVEAAGLRRHPVEDTAPTTG